MDGVPRRGDDPHLQGLVVVFTVPLVASLLAAVGPAQAAARIRPTVALRIAD